MLPITRDQLLHIAPNARGTYQDAFTRADVDLDAYGINANRLRLVHFMAQILHETDGLTILRENMNYRAERIVDVWPSRFATVDDARPFAHNPEGLANKVYGGRMGNDQNGDGWKYIGRGLLQITGKESYARYGNALGINLAGNPDQAFDPAWTIRIAAEEWKAGNCNSLAEADDVRRITKVINGGLTGFASRKEWLEKARAVWM